MSVREGHVSLWHPWLDKPGLRHSLTLWNKQNYPTDIDSIVAYVAREQQYVFCNDILDPLEIPLELLKHEKSQPYMSRTGKVVAMRVRAKKSGFFIPAASWGWKKQPGERLLEAIAHVFQQFNFEGITPSSLSEKILRWTLPEKLVISRPSHMLRSLILKHHKGGRIDRAIKRRYPKAFSYDENKAYLYHSRCVPSPLVSAHALLFCDKSNSDDRYRAYATAFLDCSLIAHSRGIHPVQVLDPVTQAMRQPFEGEYIRQWLWTEELDDCLESGYALQAVHEGYGFPEFSTFLQPWADWLWTVYSQQSDNLVKDILKQMMVGLPGRFLKSPEVFTLIHKTEYRHGDIPILAASWKEGETLLRPWFLRAEFDNDSAQLTPIGSYIPMMCRQELYHRMKKEEQGGNSIISSYIDSYTTTGETVLPLGTERGEWKEKDHYTNVWALDNQLIPEDIERMRSPGVSGKERLALYQMYQSQQKERENNELAKTTL